MYALYFILVVALCCIMMSETVAKEMREHVSLPPSPSPLASVFDEGVQKRFRVGQAPDSTQSLGYAGSPETSLRLPEASEERAFLPSKWASPPHTLSVFSYGEAPVQPDAFHTERSCQCFYLASFAKQDCSVWGHDQKTPETSPSPIRTWRSLS